MSQHKTFHAVTPIRDKPDDFTKDPEPRWEVRSMLLMGQTPVMEAGWEPFAISDDYLWMRKRVQ